ncbi:MAG: hypothetical protein IPH48_10825 [bacterium]|nr:hypothetical protein [bacterium]
MALQAKLEGFVAALKADPEFVPMTDGNTYNLLTEQRRELDAARTRLADLRTRYQEDYALVTRQKELVAVAERALRNVQSSYVRDIEIQLDEAKRVEGSFEAALSKQTQALVDFPEVEWRVESLNLQIETKRDLVKGLQLRRGEVRMRADTDRRISNIVPLDKPTIATAVAGSKKVLYLILASFLAIALGCMAALFVENQDHRLYSRRHVEQYLQLPVMGAITDQSKLKG